MTPSANVEFLFGNEIRKIDFSGTVHPNTTVLQYLRALPNCKGTKEGCAEGDCGACTVVLGEPDGSGAMRYTPVDACLMFLPMLHGKQLITVEHLCKNGELHPVQKNMVEQFGAQCGYCTPGIVMALFALYKNKNNPAREEIDDALTGNLCRCTGYRPIVEAAARSCVNNGQDFFSDGKSETIRMLRNIRRNTISIASTKRHYFKPATLPEALQFKAEHPDAILIGGATDVALRVTKKHETLESILDLSDLSELKEWDEHDDKIIIGAGLPLNDIWPKVRTSLPALYDMLTVFGSPQIRNLGTLGGNLGSASPIGDTLPVLMAYRAKIYLESVHGRRKVDMDQFITGYRKTVKLPEEIITAVKIPRSNGAVVRSYKVSKRKDLDISTVSGGFRLEQNSDRSVKSVLLAFGGMADRTKRAEKTEAFLTGKSWSRETVTSAMPLIDLEFRPISDARSGAEFRRTAARNLLLKFWSETV